jgi:hypothetical protein
VFQAVKDTRNGSRACCSAAKCGKSRRSSVSGTSRAFSHRPPRTLSKAGGFDLAHRERRLGPAQPAGPGSTDGASHSLMAARPVPAPAVHASPPTAGGRMGNVPAKGENREFMLGDTRDTNAASLRESDTIFVQPDSDLLSRRTREVASGEAFVVGNFLGNEPWNRKGVSRRGGIELCFGKD